MGGVMGALSADDEKRVRERFHDVNNGLQGLRNALRTAEDATDDTKAVAWRRVEQAYRGIVERVDKARATILGLDDERGEPVVLAQAADSHRPEPTRALVIDADTLSRRMTVMRLKALGYDPVGEATAEKGMARLDDEEHCAVALVDVAIGEESGIELCRAIRRAHPDVILFLCHHPEQPIPATDELARQGIAGTLTKPVKAHRIGETLTGVVGRVVHH